MWPPKLLTLGRSKPGSGKRRAWARKEASLGQGRGKPGPGKRQVWVREEASLGQAHQEFDGQCFRKGL